MAIPDRPELPSEKNSDTTPHGERPPTGRTIRVSTRARHLHDTPELTVRTIIRKALDSGTWISGQKLAELTGSSRTAVWKHVRAMRRDGYEIRADSGHGYRLDSVPDTLLPLEIELGLQTDVLGSRIIHVQDVDSTQRLLKSMAAEGAPEGTVVLAEKQSLGRGRLQRAWASPPGNIAMSVLLRPDVAPGKAFGFPLLAGVAAARAIRAVSGLECGLKWPNDIVSRGGKLGGVLIEMNADMDMVLDLFLGIGLNVNTTHEDLPGGLASPATSILVETGSACSRVRLVQSLLRNLEELSTTYTSQGFEPIRQAWKASNITLGQEVAASDPQGHSIEGLADDIDHTGALIIRTRTGERHAVSSGDVTLQRGRRPR